MPKAAKVTHPPRRLLNCECDPLLSNPYYPPVPNAQRANTALSYPSSVIQCCTVTHVTRSPKDAHDVRSLGTLL
eukprot:1529283-Prymnesium_polylepis.1